MKNGHPSNISLKSVWYPANEHLQNELFHIKKFSRGQNQYPFWVINKVCYENKQSNHQQIQEEHQKQLLTNISHKEVPNSKKHSCFYDIKRKWLMIWCNQGKTLYINYYPKLLPIQDKKSASVLKWKIKIN